jgi:pyruvate carboxylase
MGLGERWPEITKTYAAVNRMFGDIVKVTPSSKVVGDMALFMVAGELTREQVEDPAFEIAFPQVGRRVFPRRSRPAARRLPRSAAEEGAQGRAAAHRAARAAPAAARSGGGARGGRTLGRARDQRYEFASYLMYPAVFVEFAKHQASYGNVDNLETPVFFYGMHVGQEVAIELERGKTLFVRYAALGEPDEPATASCTSNSTASRARFRCSTRISSA